MIKGKKIYIHYFLHCFKNIGNFFRRFHKINLLALTVHRVRVVCVSAHIIYDQK